MRKVVYGIAIDGPYVAVTGTVSQTRENIELPGGEIDAVESPQDALIREYREETGLIVTPEVRLFNIKYGFRRRDQTEVRNVGSVWTVSVDAVEAPTDPSHFLIWLKLSVAMTSLRFEEQASALLKYLRWEQRPQTFYRKARASDHLAPAVKSSRRFSVIK